MGKDDRTRDDRHDPAATVPANDPPEDPDDRMTDPSAEHEDERPEDPKIEDERMIRTREAGINAPKLN